jgi:HlyD family secretion protein
VRLIEPYSFMKISALGVEEQRVNVLIDVTDPPDRWSRLGDGYAVETRIVVAERKDALKIPVGALFRDGDRWAAFEADSGRATLRILTLGLIGSLEAEVLQGLREDARVVVHPGDAVENGVRIVER